MTPIPVNFDDVEAWSGGVILGPGTHVVRCTSADDSKPSSGGHPQIELELEAISGEEQGAEIRDWIVVIPTSLGKVKQMLLAFGATLPAGDWNLDAKTLVGKTCAIVVRKKEKNDGSGDLVSRVEAYRPATDAEAAVSRVKDAFPGATEADADKDIPF